jgi:predicted permease
MVYVEALSKVLPVILLFLLGAFLNRLHFIRSEAIQDMKKLVLNVTLPAVLFLAFSRVSLEARHLLIVGIVFSACVVALLASRLMRPLVHIESPYFPALMTGFEAGMMGYAIFGAVYGAESIFKFGIIDLGQVTFVFFVLVSVLERYRAGAKRFSETLLGFFTTPVILSILLGILANRTGAMPPLNAWPVSAAVLKTVEMVSGLTTPLIALIIGYEMRLEKSGLLKPLQCIGLRLLFWVPAGLLFNALVMDQLLHLDRDFQAAVLTMFILPPPFIIPLFIKESDDQNRAFVVNTLSLSTLVTLFGFAIISVLYTPASSGAGSIHLP